MQCFAQIILLMSSVTQKIPVITMQNPNQNASQDKPSKSYFLGPVVDLVKSSAEFLLEQPVKLFDHPKDWHKFLMETTIEQAFGAITGPIFTLNGEDTVEKALTELNQLKISSAPLIISKELVGTVDLVIFRVFIFLHILHLSFYLPSFPY